jgi:signal transduction histidine kinase
VNALARSWDQWGYSREFTVAATESAGEEASSAAGPLVAVCDGASGMAHLPAGVALAILVTRDAAPPYPQGGDSGARGLSEANPAMRVVWIERVARWAAVAVALAQETALRLEAQAQAAEGKQKLREAERFAALGRFIAEARHGLGNALTGVLGHSELLLLEAGKELEGEARAQVETIHAMSLKIHETFHRLSSLDVELRLAERQAEREQAGPVQ